MRRINRYISRTVLMATFVVLFVLAAIDLLSMVITESRSIDDSYGLKDVMLYVAWSIPSTIVEHIANASFLGCVIGLGVHANANELVVIRSAGVGMRRLTWAVFRPVIFVAVVGLLLNEYVTPNTLRMAQAVQVVASGETQVLQSGDGSWHRETNTENGNNIFVYFRGLNRNLFDIVRYELDPDNKQLVRSSFAEEATYFRDDGWQFEHSNTSTLPRMDFEALDPNSLAQQKVIFETYLRQTWETQLTPDDANDIVLLPEQLSISRLYKRAEYLQQQQLESRDYWLAFWQKVLQPALIIALALVGISFVFGSMREVTIWQRTTVALLVGIGLWIFQKLLERSSLVYEFPPLVAVLVPILLCIVVGVRLLQRR